MKKNIKQLQCGECSEENHKLYLKPSGVVIVECVNCKSRSEITISTPKITIEHLKGPGTLCVF